MVVFVVEVQELLDFAVFVGYFNFLDVYGIEFEVQEAQLLNLLRRLPLFDPLILQFFDISRFLNFLKFL